MNVDPRALLGGPGWRVEALCLQTDPEIFFPGKGESCEPAKRVCQGCPVRVECLDYAISHSENDGVWGGMSPRQRRQLSPTPQRGRRPVRAA